MTGHVPVYITPLADLVCERAEYAAWHHALSAVAAQLSDDLGIPIDGPTVPACPWNSGADARAA